MRLRKLVFKKSVISATACQTLCKETTSNGCIAFNYFKRSKTCQLYQFLYKTQFGVSAGAATYCTTIAGSINSNKRAATIGKLRKNKKVANISACELQCSNARSRGCIGFNYYKKTKICEVWKILYRKQIKTFSGLPFGA